MRGKVRKSVNDVLNNVIFSGRFESRPVFMVLDSSASVAAAERLGVHEDEVEQFICQQVGEGLAKTSNPYARYETQLEFWRKEGMATRPPFTALLFCLSHAAEIMASDGKYTCGNYYVRLSELTGVARDQLRSHGAQNREILALACPVAGKHGLPLRATDRAPSQPVQVCQHRHLSGDHPGGRPRLFPRHVRTLRFCRRLQRHRGGDRAVHRFMDPFVRFEPATATSLGASGTASPDLRNRARGTRGLV